VAEASNPAGIAKFFDRRSHLPVMLPVPPRVATCHFDGLLPEMTPLCWLRQGLPP
jgi:hypothetical protein